MINITCNIIKSQYYVAPAIPIINNTQVTNNKAESKIASDRNNDRIKTSNSHKKNKDKIIYDNKKKKSNDTTSYRKTQKTTSIFDDNKIKNQNNP